MPRLIVTAVSDLACPWCYLGKSFLDEAVSIFASQGIETEIRWRVYMIDPATKPEGEEYMAYNRRRWGGDGWTQELRESAKSSADVRFGRWLTWPNSLNAHRVLRCLRDAVGWKTENEALTCLLRACYEEGQNISKLDVCLQAISSVPHIDVKAVQAALEGGRLTQEVREEDRYAKNELEISGVPHFFVDLDGARTQIDGCRPARHWQAVVRHLRAISPSP